MSESIPPAEYAAYQLWSDAVQVRSMPPAELAEAIPDLVEAREAINDAIAKAERHIERRSMATLWETPHVL